MERESSRFHSIWVDQKNGVLKEILEKKLFVAVYSVQIRFSRRKVLLCGGRGRFLYSFLCDLMFVFYRIYLCVFASCFLQQLCHFGGGFRGFYLVFEWQMKFCKLTPFTAKIFKKNLWRILCKNFSLFLGVKIVCILHLVI